MAVTLTEKAATHVQNFLAKRGKGVGLRIGVRTSGCSGFAYKLEFADAVNPDDLQFESHGVKVRGRPEEPAVPRRHRARLHPRGPERGLQVQQPQRQGRVRLRREL